MADGTKISFAFGNAGPSRPATGAAPMSNMELLLAKSKSASKAAPKPPSGLPSRSLFADEDDDDDSAPASSSRAGPSRPSQPARLPPVQQASAISRAEKRAQAAALAVDASVFDYDSVYDGMKAAERAAEQAKKAEDDKRTPKYIESFLASAQTRRLDKLRAEEKMLQLEREKEGDEFKDKEKFVTEAYKKQMEEVRRAEEEERIREEEFRKQRKGPGLTSLYKTMLDDSEHKHAAAVAAASGSTSSGPSLAIRPPTQTDFVEPEDEYDPYLAREAAASGSSSLPRASGQQRDGAAGQGPDVEINDDGEVVDKRSLLKAGLNIMKKPKPELPNSLLSGQRSGQAQEGPYQSRAVGAAAGYQERMERERRRLAQQMRDEAERKRAAEEEAARVEEEEARKRREGDDGEAARKREEAKERYLARKRQREAEQEEQAKKARED